MAWSMKLCASVAALMLSGAAVVWAEPALQPNEELLWPKGPSDSNGLTWPEAVRACIGNISIPTVAWYPAPNEKATGAAVVVIPGGGYGVSQVIAGPVPPAARCRSVNHITSLSHC